MAIKRRIILEATTKGVVASVIWEWEAVEYVSENEQGMFLWDTERHIKYFTSFDEAYGTAVLLSSTMQAP